MKIYLKSCSLYEVKHAFDYGLIDGVNFISNECNESCIATDSDKSQIIKFAQGPVFLSAFGDSIEQILENSMQSIAVGPNVVVKLKVGLESLKVCKLLSARNISVCLSEISSISQAIVSSKCGADFISFNAEKINEDFGILSQCRTLIHEYKYRSEVVCDQISSNEHLEKCIKTGIDGLSIPYKDLIELIEK